MVVAAHTRLGCGGLFGSILTIPTPRHPIFLAAGATAPPVTSSGVAPVFFQGREMGDRSWELGKNEGNGGHRPPYNGYDMILSIVGR